jgi:hypothetical protein
MKKNDFPRILFCALLIVFLIPVSSAFQQYSCFDFDPIIYGKSVQTVVSQDGKFIVTGSPDSGIVNLFYPNGTSGWSYQTNDNITSVAISNDGGFVTAATYHGNLYYFDNSGKLLWNNTGFGCNNKVELSSDGRRGFVFNSGTKDHQDSNTTYYFDFNGTVLWEKSIPQLSVTDISPDAKNAVLGTRGHYGNDVIMLSNTGSEEWQKKMAGSWIVSGAVISDDDTTVAASTDNQIVVFGKWGKVLGNITPKYLVRSIGVSPDGMLIAAGTQYQLICFNQSGMTLWDYPFDDYVYHIEFSHDGQNLVAASKDTIYYFKRNGTCLWKSTLDSKLDSISISHNGEIIVVGTYDNSFDIIDQFGNVKKINLGSIPTMPLPPVEPNLTVQTSSFSGNRTDTIAGEPIKSPSETQEAPIPVTIAITSVGICAVMAGYFRKK